MSEQSHRDKTARLTDSGRLLMERGRSIVTGHVPAPPPSQTYLTIATLAHFAPEARA